MKKSDAEKRVKRQPAGAWQYLDPDPDHHLAWSILYGILMLALGVVLLGLLTGCGGDRVTRVVTPTEPPTEPPENGGLLTLQGAGYWSGDEVGNLRCAMKVDLTPNGKWGFDFTWGCTAGLDEDTAREVAAE